MYYGYYNRRGRYGYPNRYGCGCDGYRRGGRGGCRRGYYDGYGRGCGYGYDNYDGYDGYWDGFYW